MIVLGIVRGAVRMKKDNKIIVQIRGGKVLGIVQLRKFVVLIPPHMSCSDVGRRRPMSSDTPCVDCKVRGRCTVGYKT